MKPIIERQIPSSPSKNYVWELNVIIQTILNCETNKDLRDRFRGETFDEFLIGFGSNHMWVHEKNVGDRLLIVYLN